MRRSLILIFAALCAMTVCAADPMATDYSMDDCQGSLRPYPQIQQVEYPDSLIPVFINHIGRHGARYPASATNCKTLLAALDRADSLGTITLLGRKLRTFTAEMMERSRGNWGALDSLGMAEQRLIASRMFKNYTEVFRNAHVKAISSYSPRCMMSMYSFTHQLDRLDNHMEFVTSTGRANSPLLRPFDIDEDYIEFRKTDVLAETYDRYFRQVCPVSAIDRVLGEEFPYGSEGRRRDLAIVEYYVIAGASAMSMDCDAGAYFTRDEYNRLWSCFNLRQYLQRTATTLSSVPADIAAPLLMDLINTTDAAAEGTSAAEVCLRFGHAETLMPLLSLMRVPGCYYMTNYFDTVGLHWMDFNVVPMAANLQMVLFKNKENGRMYLRTDLNEQPVKLIPNRDDIYLPWTQVREFLLKCVPLYAQ